MKKIEYQGKGSKWREGRRQGAQSQSQGQRGADPGAWNLHQPMGWGGVGTSATWTSRSSSSHTERSWKRAKSRPQALKPESKVQKLASPLTAHGCSHGCFCDFWELFREHGYIPESNMSSWETLAIVVSTALRHSSCCWHLRLAILTTSLQSQVTMQLPGHQHLWLL